MAQCPDHARELTGSPPSCPFCRGSFLDAPAFAALQGSVQVSPEQRDDSVAFVKVRVCPECRVPMLPSRIGELEAWVEQCPSCHGSWVEPADKKSLDMLAKRAQRAKAWVSMPEAQRQEIATDLAKETAPDTESVAAELSPAETVKAFIGVPILGGARGDGGPFGTFALLVTLTLVFGWNLSRPEGEPPNFFMAMWAPESWGAFLGSLFFVWPFADLVERRVHTLRLLAVFLLTGVAGALVQHLLTTDAYLGGVSSAIFGLMGAATVLQPKASIKLTVPGLIGAYRMAKGTGLVPALRVKLWVGVALFGAFEVALWLLQVDQAFAWAGHLTGLALGAASGVALDRLATQDPHVG